MTDYQEEQRNELEALESIYPDELKVLRNGPPAVFEVSLSSQNLDDVEGGEDDQASCTIQVTYTSTYPDEVPLMEVTESENVEDDQINELVELMNSEAEENLGMVMVFTIISAVQEKLHCIVEETKEHKQTEKDRQKKEDDEKEMKKFEGIRVTIENFLAWKTKFDAEMAEISKTVKETNTAKSKLTGKELFMCDASLMNSDVDFLQPEDETVEVDESLFQDMDDLDLAADDELLDVED